MKKVKRLGTICFVVAALSLLIFLMVITAPTLPLLGVFFFLATLGMFLFGCSLIAPSTAIGKVLVRIFRHPFVRFVLKRAFFYLFVAFIALNLVYFVMTHMPYDPVDRIAPPQGAPQEQVEEFKARIRALYGSDKEGFDRYINFWANLLRGNLGITFLQGEWMRPVSEIIVDRLPFTLVLVVPVLFISFFLGNWIGARAAYVKNKRSETVYLLTVFGNIIPFYWLAMILAFILAIKTGIFPYDRSMWGPGWLGPQWGNIDFIIDVLRHYALPFLTLLIVTTGGWATGMRSMTLYELDSGYILYGRQLGFKDKKLLGYAKRNAMLPQFTGLNINLNNLIGQTMIIEMVFGWRGLGLLTYQGITYSDITVVIGTFIVTMFIVIFGNFLVDITYAFVDPRIRTGGGG